VRKRFKTVVSGFSVLCLLAIKSGYSRLCRIRRIDFMCAMKLVIVGAVAAGASAAAKARRCDEDAEIILFEKGSDISYATCGLPYYLSGVIPRRQSLLVTRAEFFAKRFNVQVRTGQEVTEIDRSGRKVTVMDSATGTRTEESYDRLILATGAEPIMPPVPGLASPFVFNLKTLEDTDRIHAFLRDKKPETAVVVGGGLIGMEAVENLVNLEIDVSLVEFMPRILPFLDPEMGEMVLQHARSKGLTAYLGEKASAIHNENGRGVVKTDQGRTLPADLVIMAVGVRPNTRLAAKAGLVLGATGGIAVDEFMRTSDPNILAAGDCIESVNLVTGKPMFWPMGSAANKQGRAAGANAVGRNIAVKGFAGTIIVKIFDLAVAKTGLSEHMALAEGFEPLVSYVPAEHHAGYYPDAKDILIKTVTDREIGRLLGAQIIGEQGVDKRIDVMATALYNGMRTEDLIQLDLAYAPPYSSARDPVVVAGAVNQNISGGDYMPISPAQLYGKIAGGDEFTLVDMRTAFELRKTGIIHGAIHIPIDELRNQLGKLDPNGEIVLYCAVGLRSYLGYRILAMKGFKNIMGLSGGISSWTYGLEK